MSKVSVFLFDQSCDVFKNTTCVPFSLNWMHWVCIVAAVCYLLTRGHIFLHISPLSCVLWTASEMLSLRKCKDAVNFFCFWLVSHPLGPSIHHQSSPPSSLQCDGQQCGAILENYLPEVNVDLHLKVCIQCLCKLKSIQEVLDHHIRLQMKECESNLTCISDHTHGK